AGLDRLFPDSASEVLQREAARMAVHSRFCVLSGGPGTGKTSTVGRILALLIEQARAGQREPLRIQLAAPTGKAAAHLSFSLEQSLVGLEVDEDVRAAIPRTAATLHRCLGAAGSEGRRFRYGAAQLLPLDVMLVDEASMVDLALMTQLVEAVPARARLILLGDRDQLASVEAGAVLGDITRPGPAGDTAPSIVHLTHNYRFASDSGVGRLTRAVNEGDFEAAMAVLEDPSHPEVRWIEPGAEEFRVALSGWVAEGYAPFLSESDPAARLRAFDHFRVLSVHRHGRFGVESLNAMIESQLATEAGFDTRVPFYAGRPLGVTRNDYELELYNGDVGVVTESPNKAGGGGRALFLSADGRPRSVSTLRLGSAETVFAMSVHKSQGSEFDEVVVVLPHEDSALVTRELLYTAVSRARERVTLFAPRDVLRAAIGRRVERASGLAEALWGPEAAR
ncbi:MAG: exodeoxyribonuclease V subunit alpha, partial [Myxococcota bacterium]